MSSSRQARWASCPLDPGDMQRRGVRGRGEAACPAGLTAGETGRARCVYFHPRPGRPRRTHGGGGSQGRSGETRGGQSCGAGPVPANTFQLRRGPGGSDAPEERRLSPGLMASAPRLPAVREPSRCSASLRPGLVAPALGCRPGCRGAAVPHSVPRCTFAMTRTIFSGASPRSARLPRASSSVSGPPTC